MPRKLGARNEKTEILRVKMPHAMLEWVKTNAPRGKASEYVRKLIDEKMRRRT